MKVLSVTGSYGRKQNTGDYSSLDLFASITVELEEGEDRGEVLKLLQQECKARCVEQLQSDRETAPDDWPTSAPARRSSGGYR